MVREMNPGTEFDARHSRQAALETAIADQADTNGFANFMAGCRVIYHGGMMLFESSGSNLVGFIAQRATRRHERAYYYNEQRLGAIAAKEAIRDGVPPEVAIRELD